MPFILACVLKTGVCARSFSWGVASCAIARNEEVPDNPRLSLVVRLEEQ